MNLPKLNFPTYEFSITEKVGKTVIFDSIRKKQVRLTPEEWVRQNFIRFLVETREFPKGLIHIEASLKVYQISQRADAIVYSPEMKPLVLVECKAPDIKINEATFRQISVYNQTVKSPYLLISNGLTHYCAKYNPSESSWTFLEDIPLFSTLK